MGENLLATQDFDAMFTIMRPDVLGHPDRQDEILFRKFVPHVRHAVSITRALDNKAIAECIAQTRYEDTGIGIVVVSKEGHVLYSNAAAEAICHAQDGLTIKHRVFQAQRLRKQRLLEKMIFQAHGFQTKTHLSGDKHLTVERPSGAMPYYVSALPYKKTPPYLLDYNPTTVLIIRDPEARVLKNTRMLQDYLGLSPQEANLTARLAQGQDLKQIATALNISHETARFYLKNIYRKVGVSAQGKLIAFVSRLL